MLAVLIRVVFYPICIVLLFSHDSFGFDWYSNNIQYLYGNGYLLGSKTRDIITLEHADSWKYGQNYLFVDTINHRDPHDLVSAEAYGEAYSYFSASKITGKSAQFGPIKDVGLTLGFNAGSEPSDQPFRAYLAGLSTQFDWPIFQFLQIDFLAYKNERLSGYAFQITPSWEYPFTLAGCDFRFRGFMDFITENGVGSAATLLAQPQLLLDVGQFVGHKNHFLLGTEYQYWQNKFGLYGQNESLAQAVFMIRF